MEHVYRPGSQSGHRYEWLAVPVFLVFLTLFWCFPSRDYTAVDGAVRCIGVFKDKNLLFHGNNHLLYPFWIGRWAALAGAMGIKAANAFQFMRISQAMNGLLGAAAIAILYGILQLLVEYQIALLCTALFGLSTAVLLHATNSAEPVSGLFFALLAMRVLIEGLRRNSRSILVASGICLALALASYQGMGIVAGVCAFACFWWVENRDGKSLFGIPVSLLWITVGGLAGVCGIYGSAYFHEGIPIAQMPHQFLSLGGAPEVYSGFTVSRFVNVPFGLLRNWFGAVPAGYSGIRALLHNPQRAFWLPAALAGLLVIGGIAWLVSKALWRLTHDWSHGCKVVSLAAAAMLVFPLLYWDSGYDKLWLLPLGAMMAAIAVSFRPKLLLPKERWTLLSMLVIALGAEIAVNAPRTVHSHFAPTPYLSDAESVSQSLGPSDRIVLGFDSVSSLWLTFWGQGVNWSQDSNWLLLPASTPSDAKQWLAAADVEHRQNNNSRILFLGILDQDRQHWDDFLGKRVGIPFSSFDEYRAHAIVLHRYALGSDSMTLRAFQ